MKGREGGAALDRPMNVGEVRFIPLTVGETIRPEDSSGRSAGSFFGDLITERGIELDDKDILVLSSKVTSFFEGGQVRLDEVRPSRKARILGRVFNKDPRKVQLIIETGRVMVVVPMKWFMRIPGLRRMMERRSANPEAMLAGFERTNNYEFVVRAHAAYLDDAGIDYCNLPEGFVSVLPDDPCATAGKIRAEIIGRFGAARVILLPAAEGTGVIAGAAVRAPVELAGIRDILTKSFGTNNPVNLVKATIDGLRRGKTIEEVEQLRGVKIQ